MSSMQSTFNTKWKLYNTWSLMSKFPIMSVRKHCFACLLQWWLYMEFHSNRLLLLVDKSLEIEIPRHILAYIYQNPKNSLNGITMNLNDLKKWINSGELKELAQFCNSYLLPTTMRPWGDSVFPHHYRFIYIYIIIQR